jgi:peptidyl-prolyl cis-trans isomerase C
MKKMLIVVLMGLALFSCTKKDNSQVVATIDGEKITLQEFNKELDGIPMNMKMMVATESGKKKVLENLIVKKLLLREAGKANIESGKEFKDTLAKVREQILIESVLKKRIDSDVKHGEEDLKRYYEAHKEEFKKGTEIETRHILVKTQDEAKQIQNKLQKGEDFVELAKQYSIDPTAKTTGGDIGFHARGTLVPEYEDAAFKLTKVGQVSGIVKTQFGYHVIRLEGVKQPSYVPFEEVKEFIKQKIAQDKQKELLDKYIEELKKGAKITMNEPLLKEEKGGKEGSAGTQVEPEKQTKPPQPAQPIPQETKEKSGE